MPKLALPVPQRALSVAEAAACIGVSRSTLFALLGAGEIGSIRVGKRRLIPLAAIDSFIAANMVLPAAGSADAA